MKDNQPKRCNCGAAVEVKRHERIDGYLVIECPEFMADPVLPKHFLYDEETAV